MTHIVALDQDGTFRWTMPADVQLDLNQPVGNDMATHGGDESSALLALGTRNPADEVHNLELVDLP